MPPKKKPKKIKVWTVAWGHETRIVKPKKAKRKKPKSKPIIKFKNAAAASYNRKKKK